MPLVDIGYDKDRHRFKGTAFPIVAFVAGIVVMGIMQMFTGLAYMILFSYFMFILAVVALVHDQWVVNSLMAPTTILFVITLITDVIRSEWIGMAIHGTSAVAAIVTTTRKNTSFIVMVLASAIYGAYLFTVNRWAGVYACPSWTCDPILEAVVMLGTGFGTALSMLVTGLHYQKKGGKIDCDGGICPL